MNKKIKILILIKRKLYNFLSNTFLLIYNSILKFINDSGFSYSASISYYFLLSIIPFTTFSIIVLNILFKLFLHSSSNTINLIINNLSEVVPFLTKEWIEKNLINHTLSTSFTLINLLFLPFISGVIFNMLQTIYRKVFNLPNRHLIKVQLLSSLFVISIILVIFISNFIFEILHLTFTNLIYSSVYINKLFIFLKKTLPLSNFIISTLSNINYISFSIFLIFYILTIKFFLNIKVKIINQLIAATIFFTLWSIAKFLYAIYITKITNLNLVYGSLSSIIIILSWIYYVSMTLIFSLEILYFLENPHLYKKNSPSRI